MSILAKEKITRYILISWTQTVTDWKDIRDAFAVGRNILYMTIPGLTET
jgi:hypothetical protein